LELSAESIQHLNSADLAEPAKSACVRIRTRQSSHQQSARERWCAATQLWQTASGNSEMGDLKRVVIHQEIVLGDDVQPLFFEGPQGEVNIVNIKSDRAATRAVVEQRVRVVHVQFCLKQRQADLDERLLAVW